MSRLSMVGLVKFPLPDITKMASFTSSHVQVPRSPSNLFGGDPLYVSYYFAIESPSHHCRGMISAKMVCHCNSLYLIRLPSRLSGSSPLHSMFLNTVTRQSVSPLTGACLKQWLSRHRLLRDYNDIPLAILKKFQVSISDFSPLFTCSRW